MMITERKITKKRRRLSSRYLLYPIQCNSRLCRTALQALNNLFQAAGLICMLIAQPAHLLLQLCLHLLHTILHMQDGLNARQIDAEIAHQAAYMYDALDIAIRVQARTMRALALACR